MAAAGELALQSRIIDLINNLTDSKVNAFEPLQLKQLKDWLKLSERSVEHAYEAVQDKLHSKSLQVKQDMHIASCHGSMSLM